jgi:CubicO group peptidase (beta-lactamase class C family)
MITPAWPTTGWTTSPPEAEGMKRESLGRLIAFGQSAGLDGLLVARHGRIVTEAYYGEFLPGMKHVLNSATKGVVGTLIGIAIDRGLLAGVDQPMLEFFPDRKIAHVDDRKKAITIKHLLDMTSGIDWTEPLQGVPETVLGMNLSPDRVQFILDRPMAEAPGRNFNYNSGNSNLLSAILTKSTGCSAREFAQAELFTPLGITDHEWLADPQGNSRGGAGLSLQLRDMAKLGYLYLRKGLWADRQILSAAWIGEVERATVEMRLLGNIDLRYANQFWVVPARNACMAVGFHSQIIMVLPELDIVAVTVGHEPPHFGQLFSGLAEACQL